MLNWAILRGQSCRSCTSFSGGPGLARGGGGKRRHSSKRELIRVSSVQHIYPHLKGGVPAFNFCAQSRVVIVDEVFNRFQKEHKERKAEADESIAAAKAKVKAKPRPKPAPEPEPVESSSSEEIVVESEVISANLHRSLHFLTLQHSTGQFERGGNVVGLLDITDRSRVRILFIDQHQVLDRDKTQHCYNHGTISAMNLEALSRFSKYAEDHNIQLYIVHLCLELRGFVRAISFLQDHLEQFHRIASFDIWHYCDLRTFRTKG